MAQALVWERIAARFVDEESRHTRFCRRPDCDESARHRTQAIESFERGMELAPQIASIAEALADAQIEWDQVEDAAATYRQLVEHAQAGLAAANGEQDLLLAADDGAHGSGDIVKVGKATVAAQ